MFKWFCAEYEWTRCRHWSKPHISNIRLSYQLFLFLIVFSSFPILDMLSFHPIKLNRICSEFSLMTFLIIASVLADPHIFNNLLLKTRKPTMSISHGMLLKYLPWKPYFWTTLQKINALTSCYRKSLARFEIVSVG